MSCSDQITTQNLIDAKADAITIGEIATSKAGAASGGAYISTSTNRFGQSTQTMKGLSDSLNASADAFDALALQRVNEIGVIYDSPLRPWSAFLLVDDLRAHTEGGETYIPKAALPFTTGATFDINNWSLLQGITNGDLINDLSQTYTFPTVAAYKDFATLFPIGKTIHLDDRDADFKVIAGNTTTLDYNVIFSAVVNQSLDLISSTPRSDMLGSVFDSALLDVLMSYNEVTLTAGVYDPYVFSQSDKTVNFDSGVVFKLPDNTTTALTTIPVSTVVISGDNITFNKAISVDGNLSNNPSDAMNTSLLVGAFHVTGKGFKFDYILVTNASWVGYSEGSEIDTDIDAEGAKVTVVNSRYYATSIWSKIHGVISKIIVRAGLDSNDARIRLGSQGASATKPQLATITAMETNDSVVFESNCNGITFGTIVAEACKLEDVRGVLGSSVYVEGTQGAAFGFAMLSECDDSHIGAVTVANYQGTAGKAVAFDVVNNCSIGHLLVKGTVGTNADVEIRDIDGLDIGLITCKDHEGTGGGFRFDYDAGFANQKNLTIGRINSSGHTGLDVEVQSPHLVDIRIGSINQDATTNVEYLKNGNKYSEGTFVCAITTGSGTITLSGSNNELSYTKIGRAVTVSGRIKVSAISSPSGSMTLTALPFASADLPDLGGLTQFAVIHGGTATTWSGYMGAQTFEGSTSLTFFGRDGNSSFEVADKMQVNTTLGFSFTYFTS